MALLKKRDLKSFAKFIQEHYSTHQVSDHFVNVIRDGSLFALFKDTPEQKLLKEIADLKQIVLMDDVKGISKERKLSAKKRAKINAALESAEALHKTLKSN